MSKALIMTYQYMSDFDWNDEKNDYIEQTWGVSFEDVIFHFQNE